MPPSPPPAPTLCLILEPRRQVRSEKFFMDRCPKDEPTGKNLICKKALPISEKNWKNLLGDGIHPPPPPFGHRRVKIRWILKQLCMWLVEIANANKQLSVSKKFCFKYRISMIKATLSFSELQIQKIMVPVVTRVPF